MEGLGKWEDEVGRDLFEGVEADCDKGICKVVLGAVQEVVMER